MLKEMASLERFVCGQGVEQRALYEGTTAQFYTLLLAVSKGKWIGPGLITPDSDDQTTDISDDGLLLEATDREVLEYISACVDMPLPDFWSAKAVYQLLKTLGTIAIRVANAAPRSTELFEIERSFDATATIIEDNFQYYREACKTLSTLTKGVMVCSLLEDLFEDDAEELIERAFDALCGEPFHTIVDWRFGRLSLTFKCSAAGLSWNTAFHTLNTTCGLLRTAIGHKYTA